MIWHLRTSPRCLARQPCSWLLGLCLFCPILFTAHAAEPPVLFSEPKPSQDPAAELADVWPKIASLTNSWAAAIRETKAWQQVRQAGLSELLKLAQNGQPLAQLRLGYGYFVGDGVDQDFAEAVRWLVPAANAKLAPASFLLGISYLNGLGVARSFEQAVDHLDQAAEQGFANAQFQLGLCYLRGGPGVNQAPERGIKWLLRAAEQGKPGAQQFLAWCFASGNGVREDPEQALSWCRKAAEQGLESAQDFLGMFWASGYGTNQDWSQAAFWFRKAAERGLGIAQMHLAQCYGNGKGVDKSPTQAWHWWREAAGQGYPTAQFHAGLCRYEGTGTTQDFPAAVEWFQKAAAQQHVGAELYLGLCYWKGLGTTVDSEQAQKWWREAAVHGIALHPQELGDGLYEVERWWRDVAQQASPRVQCCLAEFYRFGQGVPQSDSQALHWYEKAAATGDASALQAAAWLLSTSPRSELRDGKRAIEWAKKAAAARKHKDPRVLDTLAAAYAETAQFSKAINTEKEAISLTEDDDQKEEYESRLKLYQARSPFRVLQGPLRQ